jgi:hypothetical protein
MADIRIICSHDALKTAEMLRRLLVAEEHKAAVRCGRRSLEDLPIARRGQGPVLLIWSYEAPSAQYVLDWAHQIAPAQLVEIATARGWPSIAGRAPVIDFSAWNGERGGRPWNELSQRLRTVAKPTAAQKPPPRGAALVLAAASTAVVMSAFVVRVHDMRRPSAPAAEPVTAQIEPLPGPQPGDGVGGPLTAVEPASTNELYPNFEAAPAIDVEAPAVGAAPILSTPDLAPADSLRAPTLLERIQDLNPLRRSGRPPEPDRH